jgi:hypothetical protein
MKRIISLLLSVVLLLSLSACGKEKKAQSGAAVLDGKKVIIIGNSHTYNGKVVFYVSKTAVEQEKRNNDLALFYQLCKANGAEVSVTNWCFSGHGLGSLFRNPCTVGGGCEGIMHEEYLTDRNYDYVVITPGVGESSEKNIGEDIAYIAEFFREANPDVKFVCLGNASVYGKNRTDTTYPGITGYYKTLEAQGFQIADWGMLVSDLIDGYSTVPGGQETYTKSTFIVNDGFHPNVLSGYIASMMLYCVITGDTAADQPRDLLTEGSDLWSLVENQLEKSYDYGDQETNFHKVLSSDSEMKGIQLLIDQYLEDQPYRQN